MTFWLSYIGRDLLVSCKEISLLYLSLFLQQHITSKLLSRFHQPTTLTQFLFIVVLNIKNYIKTSLRSWRYLLMKLHSLLRIKWHWLRKLDSLEDRVYVLRKLRLDLESIINESYGSDHDYVPATSGYRSNLALFQHHDHVGSLIVHYVTQISFKCIP